MNVVKPYKDSDASKKDQVSQMFDNVSSNYDQMNRIITFGMDIGWRKKVLKLIQGVEPTSILDIATGTADMPILFSTSQAERIVGIDISKGMLEVGREKVKSKGLQDKIHLEIGDAENMSFETDSFDAATVSYGIRNFESLEKGLSEIYRVLKPGGLFVILETSVPAKFPFKQGYFLYTSYIMPLLGKLFSKDKKAYGYLSKSAHNFPYGKRLVAILESIGYVEVELLPQAQGISTIYKMQKPK